MLMSLIKSGVLGARRLRCSTHLPMQKQVMATATPTIPIVSVAKALAAACRHHVSGIHTPKGWIAAKSDATVTF